MVCGEATVTTESQAFGPKPQEGTLLPPFALVNKGQLTVYISFHNQPATCEDGMPIEPGEKLFSKNLPEDLRGGQLSAMTKQATSVLGYVFG